MASSVINADIVESVYTATYTPTTNSAHISGDLSIPNGYKPMSAVLTSCSASGMSYQLVPSVCVYGSIAKVRIDCYYNWGSALTVEVTVYFTKA